MHTLTLHGARRFSTCTSNTLSTLNILDPSFSRSFSCSSSTNSSRSSPFSRSFSTSFSRVSCPLSRQSLPRCVLVSPVNKNEANFFCTSGKKPDGTGEAERQQDIDDMMAEVKRKRAEQLKNKEADAGTKTEIGEYRPPTGGSRSKPKPKSRTGRIILLGIVVTLAGIWMIIKNNEERRKKFVGFASSGMLRLLAKNIHEDGCAASLNLLLGIMATSDDAVHGFLDLDVLDSVFDRCLPSKDLLAPPKEEEQMTAAALITAMCEHPSVRKRLLKTPEFTRQVLATANAVGGQTQFGVMNILYKFFPEPEFPAVFISLKGPEYLYRCSKSPEAGFFFQQMIGWWCCSNKTYLNENKMNLSIGDKLTISEALYNNAMNYEAQGSKQNAVECLEQLLVLQPSHSDTYCKLGILLQQLGQADEGADMLYKSLQINPTQVQAALSVAKRMVAKDSSEETFKDAADLLSNGLEEVKRPPAPNSIPPPPAIVIKAYKLMTDILTRLNNLDEALETAHDWVVFSPNDSKAHEIMGSILTQHKEYQEALESLQTSSFLNSSSSATYYYQAQCYNGLKQPAEACQALDKAIKNEKEQRLQTKGSALSKKRMEKHVPSLFMLAGQTYSANNKPDKALEAYKTLCCLTPNLPIVHFLHGRCAFKMDHIDTSYTSFTTTMELMHTRVEEGKQLTSQDKQALAYIGNICKAQKEGAGLKEVCEMYTTLTKK